MGIQNVVQTSKCMWYYLLTLTNCFADITKLMLPLSILHCIYLLFLPSLSRNTMIATGGASQALNLLANLFFSSGDLVFIENPTYFIAIRALEHDVGLKTVPGEMD